MRPLCCLISAALVVVLTLAGAGSVVAQDAAVPSPKAETVERASFEPLTREQIDYLFDSLRANSAYQPPPFRLSQRVSADVAGIWAGSGMQVESDLGEIVLRFRAMVEARLQRQSTPSKSEALVDQFEIRIQLSRKGFLIVHPLAAEASARAGLVAPIQLLKRSPTRTTYVQGARDTGMYLSLPSLLLEEAQHGWALLMCPRVASFVPNRKTGGSDLQLLPSPYELSEAKFSITAFAQSKIETTSKKERLATSLAVTEQLPDTIDGKDELYALTPNLAIRYRPVAPFDFFRVAPKDSIQGGVLFKTEMENPVGHVRRDFYSHVLYLQKINEPATIPVTLQGTRPVKDSGPCYIVLSQKTEWKEYDKKEPHHG